MSCDPTCYVCGHTPEEHRENYAECEFEGGCDCLCFEERACEEEDK